MFRALIFPCFLLGMAVAWAAPAGAATKLDAGQMKAALRTAAPEENGFVEKVVEMVDQGKLPANLVDSTFQWARRKSEHKFQYFKKALIVRAARAGITVPG